jgi:predicted nucleotidyltransferase
MRMNPVEAASAFVGEFFPECSVAIVGGSAIRGDETPTSDLDIVIVTDREDAPFRASYREYGWPIEAFVHSPRSLRRFFASDASTRTPSLQRMCAEGAVLRDRDGEAEEIRREAVAQLEGGPAPLTEEKTASWRYQVSDLLDDFVGCEDRTEGFFIGADLAAAAVQLYLAYNRQWVGHAKWLPRSLRAFDPDLAERLSGAIESYTSDGSKQELIDFAEAMLASSGGRLFEGYYAQAPRDP